MITLVMVAWTVNPMEGEQQLDLYWCKPDCTGCEHIWAESSKKAPNDLCGSEIICLPQELAKYLPTFETALG